MALTSFEDQNTKDRCQKIGMAEIIKKPISFQVLIRIILRYHFNLSVVQVQKYLEIENI